MIQIKVFYDYIANSKSGIVEMEVEINKWLNNNSKITVIDRKQSLNDGDFIMTIMYNVRKSSDNES